MPKGVLFSSLLPYFFLLYYGHIIAKWVSNITSYLSEQVSKCVLNKVI